MKNRIAFIGLFSLFSMAHAAEICMAIADAGSGAVVLQRGDCRNQVTPASTFKIAISLMGYDAGFLKDEYTPERPYQPGYVDWLPSWKHPTNPQKWMKDSVVWYSQHLTRSLGKERFAAYTRKFEYGNANVAGDAEHDGLTMAWISSSLRISPLEQLIFLRKVVNRQLDVTQHAYAMTEALTKQDKPLAGWELHGKTGAASGFGWYVGWASKKGKTYTYARLMRRDASDPQDVSAGVLARDGFMAQFPALIGSIAP
ncbi:class D beta-lactamase [Janthinobacterium sp. BJB1]|uniref:penicillin-binding transpeptidase domain-containing protein n=1 Tax=Janthinobacterium sp. GW458P TaxID=1981504 RepID=UPI000A32A95B|nr:penicillin-binding transpeptidase domain-containing protein [Janthinobacterium sp. GW458P]MBE3024593.1 class D beta-lactamase [Janthinobacterium sp. GW458P]PHV18048.1 class D beta-lactamase [Janthinobacterium sp. BJB303]PJC99981.1 class D beta-lactamase [Janthinobacterium sp. BJB1]